MKKIISILLFTSLTFGQSPLLTLFDDETAWYGVSGLELASVDLIRIGSDMALHAILPVQSLMRGCVLNDDGTVNYYFDSDDWNYREDGVTPAKRDGSDGQVMVEIPEHYYRDWTDSTQKTAISLYPISGFIKVPKFYVSAYEATLYRPTSKLSSVATLDTNYRGGYSDSYSATQAEWDSLSNTMLGKPIYSRIQSYNTPNKDFRTYAKNRGDNWYAYTWKARVVLTRLYMIEYATKNSQKAIDTTLTSEGYKKGGLGKGVTTVDENLWVTFNERSPFIPCGITDTLANGSGEVNYIVPFSTPDTVQVCRYRGVENFFGHLWHLMEGIMVYTDSSNGGSARVFIVDNPDNFTSSDTTKGRYAGNMAYLGGRILTFTNNDFLPTTFDSGNNFLQYTGDYSAPNRFYTALGGIHYNQFRADGYATYQVNTNNVTAGNRAGIFATKADDYYGLSYNYLGTRLTCFPQGY